MHFYKHIRSLFQILLAKRAHAFRLTAARRPRIAVTAMFCLAVVMIAGVLCAAGLIHCYHIRLGLAGANVELAATQQVEKPSIPAGLSRRRKGFDDAIAALRSAANQNQRLAGYYKGVAKRTGNQAAEAATPTSGQESPDSRNARSPLEQSGTPIVAGSAASLLERDATGLSHSSVAENSAAENSAPSTTAYHSGISSDPVTDQSQPAPAPSQQASSTGPASPGAERSSLVAGDVKFDLNAAIEHWVQYYTGSRVGRSTMQQGLERCGAYLDASRAEFRQSGLPEDLVWVAQVESVWKQGAKSPVAAGGIWQFMPSTAADYGLAVGSPVDERFDPNKETRAAATYLRDLYTLFGNWELALAAYNCGEPRLMEAIVRCGQPDFWAIYDRQLLPKETCNYVPKILAAIKVASAPDSYGFTVERQQSSAPVVTSGS